MVHPEFSIRGSIFFSLKGVYLLLIILDMKPAIESLRRCKRGGDNLSVVSARSFKIVQKSLDFRVYQTVLIQWSVTILLK